MIKPGPVISHDNMVAHNALQVQKFLVTKNTAEVPHPSYSSDNALCNLFFSENEITAMRELLPGISKIQEQSLTIAHAIPNIHFSSASSSDRHNKHIAQM